LADAELGRSQVRDLLQNAVDELPGIVQVVFILHDMEEMSMKRQRPNLR
jgi:hypothetical protein